MYSTCTSSNNNLNDMERLKKRLDKNNSATSVNLNFRLNLPFENNHKIIPEDDINYILSEADQFNTERQSTTQYRLLGTITPLFHNTLCNLSTSNGIGVFNNVNFTNNPALPDEGLSYSASVNTYWLEKDGWQGYFQPISSTTLSLNSNINSWVDLDPKRNLFSLVDSGNTNWEIMITYPYTSDTTHFLVNGGLKLIGSTPITVGGKPMLALYTPVMHNLNVGNSVIIYNLGAYAPSSGTTYTVQQIGLSDGTMQDYVFVIDVGYTVPAINIVDATSRMARVYNNFISTYYFRIFKRITTYQDYELYNLNFSNNSFNDTVSQFTFNGGLSGLPEIDVANYVDNLGRPLSQLYLTIVKISPYHKLQLNTGPWSYIKSGIEMPYFDVLTTYLAGAPANSDFLKVADIHRIHDDLSITSASQYVPVSHIPIENYIQASGNTFYGDLVEYNESTLLETTLGSVNHRFNTTNRIASSASTMIIVDSTSHLYMGPRQEGYYYNPHYLIQIRNFSSTINTSPTGATLQRVGTEMLEVIPEDIPTYASIINGQYMWRELLDIGFSDNGQPSALDYPFVNGRHYIYQNYLVNLRRQDPFAYYSLYYSKFPRDPFGVFINNEDTIIYTAPNIC